LGGNIIGERGYGRLTERNWEDGISPLIEGSPMSAVACGIEGVDGLLVECLLVLVRRRLVMFGGGEDICWRMIEREE